MASFTILSDEKTFDVIGVILSDYDSSAMKVQLVDDIALEANKLELNGG